MRHPPTPPDQKPPPRGTDSDLPRFTFRPDTASNQINTRWRNKIWPGSTSQKMRVSSENRR